MTTNILIYLLGKVIVEAVWALIAGMLLAAVLIVDRSWIHVVIAFGLVAWCTYDMHKALGKLGEEARARPWH